MLTKTPARAFLVIALLLAVSAAAVSYATTRLFGPDGALIHIRWTPDVGAERRQALERTFRLSQPLPMEGTTYSYLLTDTSTKNVRALVTHPAVADTHDLDRAAFRVADTAERVVVDAAAQHRFMQLARVADIGWNAAVALGAIGLLFVVAPGRMGQLPILARKGLRLIAHAVQMRIPEVSAEGAGLFRIVFGSAAVAMFVLTPVHDEITRWILITGVLFVAGVFTRLSFAMFTAAAMGWGVVYTQHFGHHPISALLVAFVCLLPSRWGDAWSIDAWLRGRAHRARADGREYGYTIWIPGVVLGLALASAAASKLYIGGVGWILNGTVKYHFVTDSPWAPVDWGLRLGLHHGMAIALSFGAVAVESLALPAAVLGPWAVRALAAAAIAVMLAGFWLFQGVFWPAWWLLLLSFAPWHLVRQIGAGDVAGSSTPDARHRFGIGSVPAGLFLAAVVQQAIASTWRLEVPPLVSAYDMYSKTYDTPSEYPSDGGASYWMVATMADQTTNDCRVDQDDARKFGSLPASDLPGAAASVAAACFDDLNSVRALAVEERRPDIDWTAGRYLGIRRILLNGPVAFVK